MLRHATMRQTSELEHPVIAPPPTPRLAVLRAEIDRARRELQETWESTSSADRIFAVDRLLRADAITADATARLSEVHARARDAWVEARVASLTGADSGAARLAALRLTLVEHELDALLGDLEVFDALFLVAEGFLRRVPVARGHTFRELMRARDRERERLVPILPLRET